ncbi:MAG: radical SAM protein [Candidatus Omnitrophica bacterium]|nr:radical SAM protein [Candidatus Omnitrophota bacterium]
MQTHYPRYLQITLAQWRSREAVARQMLSACRLCPRACRADRLNGEHGFCRSGGAAEISHWQIHHGEEPPLSEQGGAGTIFFTHCNLSCIFCQNYQISQAREAGRRMEAEELASIMLDLQRQGAQNIDLVSPTHMVPQIIAAVAAAARQGLTIPLVYNSNGYDAQETLALLDGIVDIYLPDLKYAQEESAQRYSAVSDYVRHARAAVRSMYRQVGGLRCDASGRALSGLLVRHLVLPGHTAESIAILRFLQENIGADAGLSVMSQYAPRAQAFGDAVLNRPLSASEYAAVLAAAEHAGFHQSWMQELDSSEIYFPDFAEDEVFLTERPPARPRDAAG